ncbi:MAG: IS200/IS605 family transposase [Alphaproteobacteria bacterium]|nr:MAG: IS200/IS605 family transposase [Alphaproteobacteria bacterium]
MADDHVHIYCSFPPRLSITQVVTRLKSLSARTLFREFPDLKKRLWGAELWEDGYFVRTVGDKLTGDVVKGYIRRHRDEGKVDSSGDGQTTLF